MSIRYRFAAVGAALCVSSLAMGEIIGPFTVSAPTSAAWVAGSETGWLNVVNAPITVNTAFSGSSIIDDGWANIDSGRAIEVVFAGGVTNVAGNDAVLFDARFDAGSYTVSSDFDGFAASLALPATAFVSTGEFRAYFYEDNPGGPFSAEAFGAAFDLSSLGVPLNATVNAIRFTATNSACDPLGVGAIVPAPGALAVGLAGMALVGRRSRRS